MCALGPRRDHLYSTGCFEIGDMDMVWGGGGVTANVEH